MTVDEDKRDYGYRLKKAREAKGWDFDELARQLGVEPGKITAWENARARPWLPTAMKAKALLGVEPPTYVQSPKRAPQPVHLAEQDAIAAEMWAKGRHIREIVLACGLQPRDANRLKARIHAWWGRKPLSKLPGWKMVLLDRAAGFVRYKRHHVYDRGPLRIQYDDRGDYLRWILVKKEGYEEVKRFTSKYEAARWASESQLAGTAVGAE